MSTEPVLLHDNDRPMLLAANSGNGEIDLRVLVLQLWQERKTVLVFIAVAAILSLTAAFLMPQKWTSKAVITVPDANQTYSLDQALIGLQTLGVDTSGSRTDTFALFIKKLNSTAQFQSWVHSSSLKPEVKNNDALYREIMGMSERLALSSDKDARNAENLPYTSWTFSFSGKNPERSQQVLSAYLDFTAESVRQEVLAQLRNNIEKKILIEQERLDLDRTHLNNVRNILIQRLRYSLDIANAAGIHKPVYGQGQTLQDDPDFAIALGADGIAEKLKIETSLKDVDVLNADLQNRQYNIDKLKMLRLPDIQFSPVAYQLSPTLPLKQDGPGKSLFLVLGVLVGAMLGCGFVLARKAFNA